MKNYLLERDGRSKVSILSHPGFLIVLAIKIVTLFVVGSSFVVESYAPFVGHFLQSPLTNPYDWALGQNSIFPFPTLMLYLLAGSKLLFGFFIHSDLLTLRLPLLLADFGIFLVLIRWLKGRQEQVLWYYWCSPILFAISYVAGFLDLMPIAFLFVFLYLLFKNLHIPAFLVLGLALATKTGLVILLPFVLIYLLKEQMRLLFAAGCLLISSAVYLLLNSAYLTSSGFWQTLTSGGQSFTSAIRIDFGGVEVYVILLVYLGLLAASVVFQRLGKHIFLMFLAFALGTVTLVVLPEAGWYAWVLPFFIYFYIKEERASKLPFILLNISYFTYFLLVPNSVFFASVPWLHPTFGGEVARSAAFTLLQGTLLLNIIWVYWLGIQRGIQHKIFYKPYLIGIAGDSASGKSTAVGLIKKMLGGHNTLEVAGDDMHKWERGDARWEQTTHLNPVANNLHSDMEQMLQLKRNESIVRKFYDHTVGRFTSPERVKPKKVIVFQGLHTLYLNRTRESLDLKIFLSPDEGLRRKWKVGRDTKERGHEAEQVLKQLDERHADAEKYIGEQKKYADVVISLTESPVGSMLQIECDNSLYIDPFIELLREKTELDVVYEHSPAAQRISLVGEISEELVDELGYKLVPQIWDVSDVPQWESGYNGLVQLFLAYVIFYKAKLDHDFF